MTNPESDRDTSAPPLPAGLLRFFQRHPGAFLFTSPHGVQQTVGVLHRPAPRRESILRITDAIDGPPAAPAADEAA
jgi:hypothetical protein